MLICLAGPAVASAALRFHNPLTEGGTGRALACPDPHVIDLRRGGFRYVLVCTTDAGANGIAIHESRDLVHWRPAGYVFPKGHQPWWAARPGNGGGRFWAPEIYRIAGKWVIYFAAAVDRSKAPLPVGPRAMVLGVASAPTLRGPWRTRILHYRGQFNGSGGPQESFGGVIDPSVVRSPLDGRLYLFWAVQATQIWVGRLSTDGMTLEPTVRPVVTPTKPWECHPNCTIEAPEAFFRSGALNLLYSAASTWDGSYVLGLAHGTDPLTGSYQKVDQPVLQRGRRFIAPGHCSQPVVGPDGHTYVLYHALTSPDPERISSRRLLMLARVSWKAGRLVVNGSGRAG
jgi:GH43 family beta-xylosidase